MRITDKMNFNNTSQNLQKNRSEMTELQNQAASQRKINKPSDDPISAARVLASKSEQKSSGQFAKNINVAKSFLEASEASLTELTESLLRAKELAIQQASDAGASGETRRTVASEMEQIYQQTLQIANRKLGDRYIFSGYKTNQMPFNSAGEYSGDAGGMKIQINKDSFVDMNVSGEKIFLGENISEDGFLYGQKEAARDTQGLINLKNEKIEQLQKEEEMNQQPVQLRAPASTSTKTQRFETVTEAQSRGINVLSSLQQFETALKVNDKEMIQESIDNLDQALNQVIRLRSQLGARLTTLNATQESLQKSIMDNRLSASQLEDADLFQLVSDMTKTDSTLKATLETSGKTMNQSLLDFLR